MEWLLLLPIGLGFWAAYRTMKLAGDAPNLSATLMWCIAAIPPAAITGYCSILWLVSIS